MYVIGEYAVYVFLILILNTLVFGVCAMFLTIGGRVLALARAPRKTQRRSIDHATN